MYREFDFDILSSQFIASLNSLKNSNKIAGNNKLLISNEIAVPAFNHTVWRTKYNHALRFIYMCNNQFLLFEPNIPKSIPNFCVKIAFQRLSCSICDIYFSISLLPATWYVLLIHPSTWLIYSFHCFTNCGTQVCTKANDGQQIALLNQLFKMSEVCVICAELQCVILPTPEFPRSHEEVPLNNWLLDGYRISTRGIQEKYSSKKVVVSWSMK
jgi:hypothetical protein